MGFSTITFIFAFLPIFFLLFFLIPSRYRYIWLLIGSLIFYYASGIFNFILLISICIINYLYLSIINKYTNKKIWYDILLLINVVVLIFFKYSNNFIFPLGISFYTFNNISYIIDIKRSTIKFEKNIIYYFTYIMLFCHIMMGPLIRFNAFYDEINNLKPSSDDFYNGFKRLIQGLLKKVLVGDNLGLLYNIVVNNNHSILNSIMSLIIYGLWLYIDFSSYCDIAIGIGSMIGIKYPENFDSPYLSTSVSEFWQRWHITLAAFFKDYIYIPLGGNRKGIWRTIINIFAIWIITGIWHGNTINFFLWGIYYGIVLVIEKFLLKNTLKKWPSFLKHLYVLVMVLIGYIFFTNNTFSSIILFIKGLFKGPFIDNNILFYLKENIFLITVSVILCLRMPKEINEIINNSLVLQIIVYCTYIILFVLMIGYILSASYSPFLYNAF